MTYSFRLLLTKKHCLNLDLYYAHKCIANGHMLNYTKHIINHKKIIFLALMYIVFDTDKQDLF